MKIRQFTAEEEEKFQKNRKLIYHIVNKYNKNQNDPEYDEYVQLGRIALAKAIQTFDEKKGVKFGTYASRIIHNEILMYLRDRKKYQMDIPLETVVLHKKNGEDITLQDVIPAEDEISIEEREDSRERLEKSLRIILNQLDFKEKVVLLFTMAGIEQVPIGRKLNISRSYTSRILARARKKVKQYMLDELEFETNTFEVVVSNQEMIRITFPLNDAEKILEDFLLANEKVRKTPGFSITPLKQQIIIELSCDNELFEFVAEFLLYLKDYLSSENERDDYE